MKFKWLGLVALLSITQAVGAQTADSFTKPEYKHFVSTSLFTLANLIPSEAPPRFFQLNYGYKITPKDVILIEAITWQYHAPLGIPYGPSHENPAENFPGVVRDFGVGIAYQRFFWKGLFATVHATPFVQQYLTSEEDLIQTGFQLFMAGRVGYRFNLLKDRLFIEPSIACTYWPINTNMPTSFQVVEDKWPNYFLLEPGLNVGVQF